MLELEIVKLICIYSKYGKLVDKAFIEKLVELEIRMKKLKGYIRDIRFLPKMKENEDALAGYDEEGILYIYMPKMEELETY